jgi:hypothetical protein
VITVNVGGDSSIYRANVSGTGLSGLIVTGAISSESVQSISPAQGNAYEYIDLIPARYTTIEQASILFTVRQSWLDEHNMTPQNIVLYHLSNSTWTGLPTILLKTENGRSYYTAQSSDLSRFAIAGGINIFSGTPLPTQERKVHTVGTTVQLSIPTVKSTAGYTPQSIQTKEVQKDSSFGFTVMMFGIGVAVGIILIVLAVLRRR